MPYTIRDLRAASDDDLIEQHDALSMYTQAGVDYYLNELRRRETAAAMRSNTKLSRAALWLTVANTVVAVVAVFVSLAG